MKRKREHLDRLVARQGRWPPRETGGKPSCTVDRAAEDGGPTRRNARPDLSGDGRAERSGADERDDARNVRNKALRWFSDRAGKAMLVESLILAQD